MNTELKVLENELVHVYETGEGEKVVYGSELYKALEVKSRYREWVNRRFDDCEAIENSDFQVVGISAPSGQTKIDHIIKLDTAKEMAILELNEKGKQIHRYFIEVEKRYETTKTEFTRREILLINIVNARTEMEKAIAIREYEAEIEKPLLETIEKQDAEIQGKNEVIVKQDRYIEKKRPFVLFAQKMIDTEETVSMGEAAKMLREDGIDIGRNDLFELLRIKKWVDHNNIPYQKYVTMDLFKVKPTTKNGEIFSVIRVSGKGLVALNHKVRQWMGLDDVTMPIEVDGV